ncbi:MAG: NADH-quinone oxidoreductase subunit C [Candidatus Margulisiibacteriota bacterium]
MTEEKKIQSEGLLKTCAELRKEHDLLVFICAVDYPDRNVIEIIYYLRSLKTRNEFKLRTEVPRKNAKIDSVCGVWSAANWHERELFDLFGIEFAGHPDMRRVLLPEDWEGYPLLKDYQRPGVMIKPETVK